MKNYLSGLKGPCNQNLTSFFSNLPYPLRFYDPTGMIKAYLYREVPHMLHAKYQPYRPDGSGKEAVRIAFTI